MINNTINEIDLLNIGDISILLQPEGFYLGRIYEKNEVQSILQIGINSSDISARKIALNQCFKVASEERLIDLVGQFKLKEPEKMEKMMLEYYQALLKKIDEEKKL